MQEAETASVRAFITRWERSGASERANYQLFLSELCDVIGVPHPDPATPDTSENEYVFERSVTFHHGDGTSSIGRIDLYKRGCFVLEAKQGKTSVDSPVPLSAAVKEKQAAYKPKTKKKESKTPWPAKLPQQVRALREALEGQSEPIHAENLARSFRRARTDRVEELLQTLVALGQARRLPDGRYIAG